MKQKAACYHKLKEVPLTSIRPEGILKAVLCAEKDGMPGHLDEIGRPYSEHCWGQKSLTEGGYQEWWPYEQTAYWLDSMIRLSVLLRDRAFYAKVKEQIKKALEGAGDGFIGPVELKEKGKRNQWPHAVLFRALTALAQAGEDFSGFTPETLYGAMAAHYKTGTCEYTCFREVVNTESMLKLYELTGDGELFDLAVNAYAGFNREYADNDSSLPFLQSDRLPNQHGVTYNEQAKLPAIFYLYTGNTEYLAASVKAYEKIDRFFMLPDGVHSSCEFMLGNDSLQAHETCDIADYTWSMGYLLMATGDTRYADNIERACLNAGFGAIGPNFRTIQYFSSPNQTIAARNSTHTVNFRDTPRFAYQPHHYPECCIGNVGRILPNYAARMYMETETGTAILLYGESAFMGDGFVLKQEGRYPFEDTVRITVACDSAVSRNLLFRIPGWCDKAVLKRNGETVFLQECDADSANKMITVPGPIRNNDRFDLILPMELKGHTSADNGRYFTYGPLLMALKIEERWEVDREETRQTEEFPAYNVYPETSFSYCVSADYDGEGAELIECQDNGFDSQRSSIPWWDGAPFEIRIPAKTLPGFGLREEEITADSETAEKVDDAMVSLGASMVQKKLILTPPLPDRDYVREHAGEAAAVTLVPYGTARLRLSVFPAY